MRSSHLLLLALMLILPACSSDTAVDGDPSFSSGGAEVVDGQAGLGEDEFGNPLTGTEVEGEDLSANARNGARPGTQQDLVVNVGDRVFFGFDRYDLTSEARAVLEKQAEWLRRYPHLTISVEGHADERGTREYNLALGDRRANAVKNYLSALGIDTARMTTISFGKERPAVAESNPSAWAQNRRSVTVIE